MNSKLKQESEMARLHKIRNLLVDNIGHIETDSVRDAVVKTLSCIRKETHKNNLDLTIDEY